MASISRRRGVLLVFFSPILLFLRYTAFPYTETLHAIISSRRQVNIVSNGSRIAAISGESGATGDKYVFGGSNNLLDYDDYRKIVYQRVLLNDNGSSPTGRWVHLTGQQKDILKHINYNVGNDSRELAGTDFALKEVKQLPNYKNPCWEKTKATRAAGGTPLGNQLRCLPYFFIIGTSKCGSTDVYAQLKKHPSVVFGKEKEPHWWSQTRFGSYHFIRRKRSPLDDYINLFSEASKYIQKRVNNRTHHSTIAGEASVDTLHSIDQWPLYPGNEGLSQPAVTTAHHIRDLLPNIKLIVLLRNPVTRMYSNYNEAMKDKGTAKDFHERVLQYLERMKSCLEKSDDHSLRECSYDPRVHKKDFVRLQAGLYGVFLSDWFRIFPKEQFRIYTLEEYQENRMTVLNDLARFLGIGPFPVEVIKNIEKAAVANAKPRDGMFNETKQLLTEFYRPYNKQFVEMMGDKKFDWIP